jgi:chromosome segregation ATPase
MEIAQAVEMLKSLAHNYGTEDHISAINKIENRIVALQQDLVSYGDNIHVCQVEIATLKDAIAELEAQVATLTAEVEKYKKSIGEMLSGRYQD